MKLYSGQMNFVTGKVSWVFPAVWLISIYCVLSQSQSDDIQKILLPPTRKGPIKIDSKFPNSHEGKICDILKWNDRVSPPRYDPLLPPCSDGMEEECQEKSGNDSVCTLWTQLDNIDKENGNKYSYYSSITGETYYFHVEIGVYVSPSLTGRIEIGSMYPESNKEKICFIINLNKGNDPLPICSDGMEEDCQEKDASRSICTLWTQLQNIDKTTGNKYSYSITGETYYFYVEIGDGNECKSYPCVHGTCYSAFPASDYHCICYPGYNGANCQNEIDECDPSPCVHGNCTDLINGYQCTCSPGFTGSKCEIDIDECDPSPCVHGNCTDLINGYHCTCSPGYSGSNCSEDIDECDPSPCVHGNCTDLINGYHCTCSPGYSGSNCSEDIDECSSSPCVHGSCNDRINGYHCICSPGYSGSNCSEDIDECSSSPCVHGSCNDRINGYHCICSPGYSGSNCSEDNDECSSSPCVHGACTDRINGYQCTCSPGYMGSDCSEDIDECSSSPCEHGACTDRINGYHCICSPDYTGSHCEKVEGGKAKVVWIPGVVIILILLIVGVVCYFKKRRQKKDQQNGRSRTSVVPRGTELVTIGPISNSDPSSSSDVPGETDELIARGELQVDGVDAQDFADGGREEEDDGFGDDSSDYAHQHRAVRRKRGKKR